MDAEQDYWIPTGEAFARYLITCGKSSETARTYMSALRIFWRWCKERRVEPFCAQRADVRAWSHERQQAVSKARAHNDLAALRLFYAWVIERGERDDDPTDGVKVRRTKQAPTRPFTLEEFDQLLAAADCERDRLIMLTFAHTGMRISELIGLTVDSFDWYRGAITIRGKGDKERTVTPSAALMGRLRAFVGMFPEGPIWHGEMNGRPSVLSAQGVRFVLRELGTKAKIDHVHPHRFRAMFGTEFLEAMPDIQALQYLMGHESIETTARYTWWTREQRGNAAMRKLSFGEKGA